MKLIKRIMSGYFLVLLWTTAYGQTLPISENWYRIPYANGTALTMGNDFVDHAGGVSGANALDMWATSTSTAQIVAAADGIITQIIDTRSGCRCASDASCGNNIVIIQHANNEFSVYMHLVQNSVTGNGANQAGLAIGDNVTQGQFIGIEGDVGFTCTSGATHPNGTSNRAANLPCSTAPLQAPNCFQHLHFEVWRGQPFTAGNFRVNPKICTSNPNIVGTNYILDSGQSFTADACNNVCPSGPFNLPATESNTYKVYTSSGFITSSQDIQSTAGIEYQANNRITLIDGFRASNGSFFRGAIQDCGNPLPILYDPSVAENLTDQQQQSTYVTSLSKEPGIASDMQVAPNPFSRTTTIEYKLLKNSRVTLWIEDMLGRKVKILLNNAIQNQGTYKAVLDASGLQFGTYLVFLKAGEYHEFKRIVVVD